MFWRLGAQPEFPLVEMGQPPSGRAGAMPVCSLKGLTTGGLEKEMADITFSMNDDQSQVIFSARTPKGEKRMGAPEVTIPVEKAQAYREAAQAAGLIVVPFT